MGDYASQAELEDRFEDNAEIEFLCDVAEGSGMADADVVIRMADVIEAAEGEINSALARKYATPVDTSVDATLLALLKRKTLDLAETYLNRRGEELSEVKRMQREAVLEWCDKVAKGERKLVGAVTVPTTTSSDPRAAWSGSNRTIPDSSARIFTRDTTERL